MSKRVAILTGGGDVPGLNMCLKSLVYRLIDLGFEPIGVRKGWEGLVRYNPSDPSTYSENFIELTKNMMRPIDRTPGSFLHSSRFNLLNLPDERARAITGTTNASGKAIIDQIIQVTQRLDFVGIIVIGGDDNLQYAAKLSAKGVPIIGIPKTIHNNIFGTDYTLGFSTSLARGVAFIHELRALASSREEIVVVETFSAESGYSTLLMAMLAGVDRVLIPEVPYNADRLAALALQDKRETPANYCVVMVCDGSVLEPEQNAKYAHTLTHFEPGHEHNLGSGFVTAHLISEITGEEVVNQPLTFLLRTGTPDGQDLLGATNFAFLAADLLSKQKFGRMTAFVKDQMWTDVDLGLAIKGTRHVDVATMYDAENYKPKLELIWSLEER
jgi:ATP-dependent phosphofructokinase / diphosphate-dependent phosphofructokinase